MMKQVWRDADGRVVNIGPWDYKIEEQLPDPTPDGARAVDDGERVYWVDGGGNPIAMVQIVHNPLPEGVTCAQEEEVVENEDGGLTAADDYSTLRRFAYPPIADQLDAIFKGGDALTAMQAEIAAVKGRYPKPNGADA